MDSACLGSWKNDMGSFQAWEEDDLKCQELSGPAKSSVIRKPKFFLERAFLLNNYKQEADLLDTELFC